VTLKDSIAKYQDKTGETFEVPPDCAIKIIDNEFMIWKLGIREGVPFFWIDQSYAKSFSTFVPFIREVCKAAEIEWIVTATQRNPKIYEKKWKMERIPEFDYEHDGRSYFILKGHIINLR
jgi:hypothetical protein